MRKRVVAIAGAVLVGVAALAIGAKPIYAPKNTSPPAVSGTTEVGDQLTCSSGSWTRSPSGYSYSWENSPDGSTWSVIGGATSTPYTLAEADETKTVRCRVTATKGTTSGQAVSSAVGPVTGPSEDFFVATTGSDSNPGTSGSPFLTMDKCYDTMSIGETCEMAAGTYATQSISGTKAGEVTIKVASGATVQIGARAVLDNGSAGGNDKTTFTPDSLNAINCVGANCTAGFQETSSSCSPVSAPCQNFDLGFVKLRAPVSGRTSTGWTGVYRVSCDGTPCAGYDGALILDTGATLGVSAERVVIDGSAGTLTAPRVSMNGTESVFKDSHTNYISVNGADGVQILGGSVGNWTNGGVGLFISSSSEANDGLVRGVEFENSDGRDCGFTSAAGCHGECVYIVVSAETNGGEGTSGWTFDGNTFSGCMDFDFFIQNGAGNTGTVNDLTIINNFFDRPISTCGGQTKGDGADPCKVDRNILDINEGITGMTNLEIMFNSFAGKWGIGVGNAATYTNAKVKGNIGWHGVLTSGDDAHPCARTGFTCTYNFWANNATANVCPGATETNATCAVVLANVFENEATALGLPPNLHIQTSPSPSPLGYVPTDCPATDIDGAARPGTNCDAGADEVG
jgi:hypothetical protein